jgi:putative phosphoribosyl transferase
MNNVHTRTKIRAVSRPVVLRAGPVMLEGEWCLPAGAQGMVLFAHGSGSSRHSPRNQFVARILQEAGVGTLLFDLLTPEEEQRDARNGQLRFDISFLSQRLMAATRWVADQPEGARLGIGYFGSSTGGAAALVAAARLGPGVVDAVVSRGGRPDLAGDALRKVAAPTLLIVGGWDDVVLELNERSCAELRCERQLAVVPRATHLFEEPGALEEVARLAANWFHQRLKPRPRVRATVP